MKKSAIERSIDVMKACSVKQEGISFSELQKYCGHLTSTALTRVLKPLMAQGIVEKDSKTGLYKAGHILVNMSRTVLGVARKEELLQPFLDNLSCETGESSAYFDWNGSWIVLLAKAEAPNSFHYADLYSSKLHSPRNVFFKVVLSHVSEDVINVVNLQLDNYDEAHHAKCDELNVIKDDVYVIQEEPIKGGIIRIVSPVFYGDSDKIAGSIGITTHCNQKAETYQQMAVVVEKYANQASMALEYHKG